MGRTSNGSVSVSKNGDCSGRVAEIYLFFKTGAGACPHFEKQPLNLYLLLFPKGPLQAALRNDPQLFPAVFEALREIDTAAFLREGRVIRRRAVQDGAEGIGALRCGPGGGGDGRMEAGAAESAFRGRVS